MIICAQAWQRTAYPSGGSRSDLIAYPSGTGHGAAKQHVTHSTQRMAINTIALAGGEQQAPAVEVLFTSQVR